MANSDFIPYPTGILKPIFKLPLLFYRIGAGWAFRFLPYMVLTTRGRISGKARHVVLEYRRHGTKLYVISGWGNRPHWVKNLEADPKVTLQMGGNERPARAQVVEDTGEALRALYMFQRSSRIAEAVLAQMSSAEKIDLRTLKRVANEFTVVRFDLADGDVAVEGVRPTQRWMSFLPLLLAIGWAFWRIYMWRNRNRKSAVTNMVEVETGTDEDDVDEQTA